MARRVRRVWFAVLGATSDLSWMDDSTDQGGPQGLPAYSTSQQAHVGRISSGQKRSKSQAGVGCLVGWARKRRVPGVDQAQDYLG